MRLNYAIAFVSDMKQSVAFYRDVLGIKLKFESPHWCEFATEGATLALHPCIPEIQGKPKDPNPHPGQCRPGFSVANLDAFHQKMTANKVHCVQEPKAVFGARIAQYLDPDGLVISVSEERKA